MLTTSHNYNQLPNLRFGEMIYLYLLLSTVLLSLGPKKLSTVLFACFWKLSSMADESFGPPHAMQRIEAFQQTIIGGITMDIPWVYPTVMCLRGKVGLMTCASQHASREEDVPLASDC